MIKFDEKSGKTVARAWHVAPGLESEPERFYAGIDPGALFRSDDAGRIWKEVESLSNHPTRQKWTPGAGGLMVHCSSCDPNDSKKMFVGISAAGVFCSEDGGKSWEARNKGVLADFDLINIRRLGSVHVTIWMRIRPNRMFCTSKTIVESTEATMKERNGLISAMDCRHGSDSRFRFILTTPTRFTCFRNKERNFGDRLDGKFGCLPQQQPGEPLEEIDEGTADAKHVRPCSSSRDGSGSLRQKRNLRRHERRSNSV